MVEPTNASKRRGRREEQNTRASTLGAVPFSITLLLLGIALAVIYLVGSTVGFPSHLIAIAFGAGLLAAAGVRIARYQSSARLVAGITVLWTAAMLSAAATSLLIFATIDAGGSVILAVILAPAAVIVAFGIFGSTLKSFGQGVSRTVLSRYFFGTLVLAGISIGVAVLSSSQTVAVVDVVATTIPAYGSSVSDGGTYVQAGVTITTLTVFLLIVRQAVHAIPFEVFVSAREMDRAEVMEHRWTRAYQGGFAVTGLYTLVLITHSVVSGSDYTDTASILQTIVEIGATSAFHSFIVVSTVILVLLLGLFRMSQRLPNISGASVSEILVPPLIIVTVAGIGTIPFDAQLQMALSNASSTPIPGFILNHTLVAVLLLLTATFLATAAVLAIPTILAGVGTGDTSLIGITSAVAGLTVIVLVAVVAGQPYAVIIPGVVATGVIWDLGEFTTVAVGETRAQTPNEPLPDGFNSLTSVHLVGTIGVAILAIAGSGFAVYLFGSLTVPTAAAIPGLILAGVAVGLVIQLIAG